MYICVLCACVSVRKWDQLKPGTNTCYRTVIKTAMLGPKNPLIFVLGEVIIPPTPLWQFKVFAYIETKSN